MARTTALLQPAAGKARNAVLSLGAAGALLGTVIDQANGMFTPTTKSRSHKILIGWYNSAAGTHVLTIRGGAYPPAESFQQTGAVPTGAAATGDLVCAGNVTLGWQWITGLDGARFLQKDGTINFDFDAGTTGAVYVFEMPA